MRKVLRVVSPQESEVFEFEEQGFWATVSTSCCLFCPGSAELAVDLREEFLSATDQRDIAECDTTTAMWPGVSGKTAPCVCRDVLSTGAEDEYPNTALTARQWLRCNPSLLGMTWVMRVEEERDNEDDEEKRDREEGRAKLALRTLTHSEMTSPYGSDARSSGRRSHVDDRLVFTRVTSTASNLWTTYQEGITMPLSAPVCASIASNTRRVEKNHVLTKHEESQIPQIDNHVRNWLERIPGWTWADIDRIAEGDDDLFNEKLENITDEQLHFLQAQSMFSPCPKEVFSVWTCAQ